MFQKILMPLDMTFKHRKALDTAADLARQGGGEVTLLHVIELIHGMSREEEKEFYDRLEQDATKHLGQYHESLRERGVSGRAEVLFGVRAAEVLRYARTMAADLIVLTAPAVDPNNLEVGWGSLSYKVGIFAPCPVLLVK
jgi:nucleotide-binding universal stress UspA family protein